MLTKQQQSEQEKLDLATVVRRIDKISTLPSVAHRVMAVADDPDAGAHEMKEVMENDPSLSARILRCINSAAFGLRKQTTNLQQAISYLGMKQIRNLAVTASVSELFAGDDTIGPYCRSQLWRHMVSVGICARLIAMRRRLNEFEDAFLAGLLHDIGIVLEDQYLHEPFVEVVHSLDQSKTLAEIERTHLGFDHTRLGAEVAKTWGFPEVTEASIRHHHASAKYRGTQINIVRCVEVANLICTLKGVSSVGLKLVEISEPALTGLSLTREDITVLADDLDQELEASAGLFEI